MGNNIFRQNNILIYSERADNGSKDVAVMAKTGLNWPEWVEKGRKWHPTVVFLHIIFRGSIKLQRIFRGVMKDHILRRCAECQRLLLSVGVKKWNNYMFYRAFFFIGVRFIRALEKVLN